MLARFHSRMCRCCLGQREHAVHRRAQRALSHQRPDLLQQITRQHRLERIRTRTHRRSGDGLAFDHQLGHVDFRLGSAQHRNRHQPPFHRHAIKIALGVAARDHIQHHFAALAAGQAEHFGRKISRAVINRVIGPQRQRGRAFIRATAGHDHRQPEQFGQLYRHRPDARSAAMHQQRLAVARKPAFEHIVPHGEQRFGQSRRFFHRQAIGHRQAMFGPREAIASVAAARHQRANTPIDPFMLNPIAQGGDHACNFQTRQIRSARRRRISASALQAIRAVDPGMADPHQYLARARHRQRALDKFQHLWPARFADRHSPHECRQRFAHCHPRLIPRHALPSSRHARH